MAELPEDEGLWACSELMPDGTYGVVRMTTERGWMTVPGWTTAHLLAPAGNGWKAECGRHITTPPSAAAADMRRCGQCTQPAGQTYQRPRILPREQPSRASRS